MCCLRCGLELFASRRVALRLGWQELRIDTERYWLCPAHGESD